MTSGTGGAFNKAVATQTLTAGAWTNIVGTYDKNKASNNLCIYINGVQSRCITATGTSLATSTNPLTIGKPSSGTFFNGEIDDVRIYNRALSSDEVMNITKCRGLFVFNIQSGAFSELGSGYGNNLAVLDSVTGIIDSTTYRANFVFHYPIIDPDFRTITTTNLKIYATDMLKIGSSYWTIDGSFTTFIDEPPQVTYVGIKDTSSATYDMIVSPKSCANSDIAISATVTNDNNDIDCSEVSSVTAYICDTTITGNCNANSQSHTYAITLTPEITGSCNFIYTGSTGTPEYFKLSGGTDKWRINVTANENIGGTLYYGSKTNTFTYRGITHYDYPNLINLASGNVNLGEWNTNTVDKYYVKNCGNNQFNLNWQLDSDPNKGNPCCRNPPNTLCSGTCDPVAHQNEVWTIGNDFYIDDDSEIVTDMGVALTLSGLVQFPTSSIGLCTTYTCLPSTDPQANIPTYYHIFPPTGLIQGTFTNEIVFEPT